MTGEAITEQLRGEVLSGDSSELRARAKEALERGDDNTASRLYTMAIDLVARDMPRNANGVASAANLFSCNGSSGGELAKLLSNRSLVYLKQGDVPAALEDAETCTLADPSFEKGYMRLVAALEASGAPLEKQLEACERGLEQCPGGEMLTSRKWRLKKAFASKAEGHDTPVVESRIHEIMRIANDESHPRRAEAAADLGSCFAVGSHGVDKDVERAERFLRVGAEGGEITAMRNLGVLLLQTERPGEAAERLREATLAGDEQAADLLRQLADEAASREEDSLAKLRAMAEDGDQRAVEMLAEWQQRQKDV